MTKMHFVLGAEHATATLAVGLEAVAKGNVDLAVQALTTISLVRLHRVGYTITLRLSRYARTLASRAATAGEPTASVPARIARRTTVLPVCARSSVGR